MTLIHASGTSESHYRAERATITARVSISSRSRSKSIATATELHNRLVARAQELRASGDATWHSASPISTWARKTYAEGSSQNVIIEHVTSSNVRVKLSNLELVSAVVTELSEAGAETSVEWALTEASRKQHERTARKAAVGEARKVAEDYAEALGKPIVRVVSISDGPTPAHGGPAVYARASAAVSENAEVTITEITVKAEIAGVFETEE